MTTHQIDIEFDEIEGCYVLSCSECSWRKHYFSTESRLDNISTGEPGATHCGGMGGLMMGKVEVKQKDYLAPFKEFLND